MTTRHADNLESMAATIERLTTGWTETVTVTRESHEGRRRIWTERIQISHEGLLTQLHTALSESTPADVETGPRSVPDSAPPLPEQPFSVLMAYHAFLVGMGMELHQVVGYAATAHPDTVASIALELLAIARRAEVALGHAYAPRSIPGCCPICQAKGTLRVNMLQDQGPVDAYCTSCQTKWDTPSLGILAGMLETG